MFAPQKDLRRTSSSHEMLWFDVPHHIRSEIYKQATNLARRETFKDRLGLHFQHRHAVRFVPGGHFVRIPISHYKMVIIHKEQYPRTSFFTERRIVSLKIEPPGYVHLDLLQTFSVKTNNLPALDRVVYDPCLRDW